MPLAVLLWELILDFLIFCFLAVFQSQLNFVLDRSSNPFSALSLLNSNGEILITIGKISPRGIINLSLNINSLNAIPSLHVINHL